MVGRTVRDARFRTVYNAAIIAVHRDGVAIHAKIGDIELEPGDTLLLEAPRGFVDLHRNSSDFHLVSPVADFALPRHDRRWRAFAVFGLLIACLTLAPVEPVLLCLGAALLMVCSGCVPIANALGSIPLQVIVVIDAKNNPNR